MKEDRDQLESKVELLQERLSRRVRCSRTHTHTHTHTRISTHSYMHTQNTHAHMQNRHTHMHAHNLSYPATTSWLTLGPLHVLNAHQMPIQA